MAQTTGHHHKGTTKMAESRIIHEGEKHQRNPAQPDRRRHISPEEKQYIRDLYALGFSVKQITLFTGWGKTAIYRALALNCQKRPRWTEEENQILVDGYLELKRGEIGKVLSLKLGRSTRAIYTQMHYYRQKLKKDPKKTRALRAITMALRAVRQADIFREYELTKEMRLQ